MRLTFRSFIGADVGQVLDDLARLRIAVFRDWPYLYDGDLAYERRYLELYTNPRAIVVGAFDGGRMVGAATGMPLTDHDDDFGSALAGIDVPMSDIFYCAESVLLPGYRGQGAGHAFFDAREDHGRTLGLTHSAFCGVQRPTDHPARPADYLPLDAFWRKRGYTPVPGAIAHFAWKDLGGEAETEKPLQFWMKPL
jgi:GNAT superfamily N-acetyltransferase